MEGTSAGGVWAEADVVNALDVIARSFCNRQDGQWHAKEGLTADDHALPDIEHHIGRTSAVIESLGDLADVYWIWVLTPNK